MALKVEKEMRQPNMSYMIDKVWKRAEGSGESNY